jgi:hypothetical protein
MKKYVSVLVALGLAVAIATPAVAGTGGNGAAPTMKSTCAKAKMKWDDHSHKCCSDMTASGHCM